MTREQAINYLYSSGMSDEQVMEVVEALKTEPCEDCISRQAVLDAMYALCNTDETLKENPWRDNPHIDAIIDAIEDLPPVTPQPKTGWIPVEEKLPEEQDNYLVIRDGNLGMPIVDKATWFRSETANHGFYKANRVIAWMPLPQPYEPQERSDEE